MSEDGLITPEQWALVQAEYARSKKPVALILEQMGFKPENAIKNALELTFGVSYANPNNFHVSDECLHFLSFDFARQNRVLPIKLTPKEFAVVMVDPNDSACISVLKTLADKRALKIFVCSREDFEQFKQERLED